MTPQHCDFADIMLPREREGARCPETDQHAAAIKAAHRAALPVRLAIVVIAVLGILALVAVIGQFLTPEVNQPVRIIKGPNYNEVPAAKRKRGTPQVAVQQPPDDKAIADREAEIMARQQEMRAAEAVELEQRQKDAGAMVYSPEQIAAAFADNEVNAEQRFAAPFNTSGYVINLETGLFSGSHMMLSYGIEVECSFSEQASKALVNLHRGDPINLTASNARRILGVVTMDCQVR
jgi:hypothetical protein